jgi:catechol 2,3-dioxygenase-like lactoylglutathione lyase family enzyme
MTADKSQIQHPVSSFKISEIILKTARLEVMKAWYTKVLAITPFFEHAPPPGTRPLDLGGQTRAADLRMCFFRVSGDYPFTQMIGIFEEPGTLAERVGASPGLHHMQLMLPALGDLCAKYEALAALGLLPHRSTDHGIMTSFYYRDPDGNNVELTVQNFPSLEAMDAFMASAAFIGNPSGKEIDAAELVAQFKAGVPASRLTALS